MEATLTVLPVRTSVFFQQLSHLSDISAWELRRLVRHSGNGCLDFVYDNDDNDGDGGGGGGDDDEDDDGEEDVQFDSLQRQ